MPIHHQILAFTLVLAPLEAYSGGLIGVDDGGCVFNDVASALAAAGDGSTLYVTPGTYTGLLGVIGKSVTVVPARAGSDCSREDLFAESADVILDGDGESQGGDGGLVHVTDGASVTFRHIILRNTLATNGGVIAVTNGATVTLDDVLVSDGDAVAAGGLIYVLGTLTNPSRLNLINDTTLVRGLVPNGDGGAIAVINGEVSITDGNIGIAPNLGANIAGNNGGGIYAVSSQISLSTTQARIHWNEAGNFGGGLYLTDSDAALSGALIRDNSVGFSGGGIFLDGGTLTVADAEISFNQTENMQTNQGGGGVYVLDGEAEFSATLVTNNQSATSGGGIYGREGSEIILRQNSQVLANSARSGGGIFTFSDLEIEGSTIDSNVAEFDGGGVYCFACSEVSILNSSVGSNEAQSGGAIHVSGAANGTPASISIESSGVSDNQASSASSSRGQGGAVRVSNANLTIISSDLTNNTASRSGGGVFHLQDGPSTSLLLERVNMSNNVTLLDESNIGGGGLFVSAVDSVLITGQTWRENVAGGSGGAIRANDSELTLQGMTLLQNQANSGAGIFASNSDLTLSEVAVGGNDATFDGGGIFQSSGALNLDTVQLSFNSADRGGGLYSNLIEGDITNSQIVGNTVLRDGGGLFLVGSNVSMAAQFSRCDLPADSCSRLSDNEAGERGGGAFLVDLEEDATNRFDIRLTAIAGNQAPDEGAAILMASDSPAALIMENVLVAENGTMEDDSTTLYVEGESDVTIASSTLVANNDQVLAVNFGNPTMDIRGTIIYLNSAGPQVASGIQFSRSCNNSQAVLAPSQSMGGTLGNPLFDGGNPDGDYRLTAFSPSVDRCFSGPIRDLDGKFRDQEGFGFDQGAFEFNGADMAPDPIFDDGFESQ